MNEKQTRPTLKGVLQTVAILLAGLMVFLGAEEVLRTKGGDKNIMLDPALECVPWDVVFIGSSHANNALYPMQIWEEHGFLTYNNAQSGQILPFTYYACRDMIERMHPKVVVLDLYMLYHPRVTGNVNWAHQSLDTLKLRNRIPAAFEVVKESQTKEFLVPMTLYHTRWKELTAEDFAGRNTPLLKGCGQSFEKAEELAGMSCRILDPSEKRAPANVPREYLEKIIALCEETGTELVLITLPYLTSPEVTSVDRDMYEDQAIFNWAGALAEKHGLRYINYFHLVEELGIVWTEHYSDYSHMNYWGGEIITRHIGQYLKEAFAFADRRSDPAYAGWNEDLAAYRAYLAESPAAK